MASNKIVPSVFEVASVVMRKFTKQLLCAWVEGVWLGAWLAEEEPALTHTITPAPVVPRTKIPHYPRAQVSVRELQHL